MLDEAIEDDINTIEQALDTLARNGYVVAQWWTDSAGTSHLALTDRTYRRLAQIGLGLGTLSTGKQMAAAR